MTVGKAIFSLLSANTDLSAIVDNRIFPEVAQQDAVLPYVVYNISSNEPSDTKREPSKMDTAQIEVNLYSTSYTECIDMATHVRAALDRVTGTYAGVNVQSIQYLSEIIDFDEAQRTYNISADYDVRISRSDFEIAQGSPITGVTLGELSDVDTTGVTDGQVIAYDAAAEEWQPADDAGGVTELGQLDDVTLSNTAQGELLKYDGNDWVNDTIDKSDVSLSNVDNTSDADKPVSTATQTALDDKADTTDVPTELDDLDDVKFIGAPSNGDSLVYNSGFFMLGQAGATTLGALDDVNTVGAAFGSLLSYNGTSWDISAAELPTDDVYFHQRYATESEALRAGATATVELYFTCTAQGNGLAEDSESDTPTAGKVIKRKIYYSEAGFADPDTGTWVEFTTLADDITFANAKAALLEYLKARTGGTVPISLKQTWEEVDEAPAFTGLLNETYGSGAEAAYSTRRLNGNVTDCMVIRRASDSTTTTIGFVDGDIDEAAIETFCTGTTCTVYQWLDQSGNDNTATAPSTGEEPTIYTGGAIVKENGKAAIDTNDQHLLFSSTLSFSSDFTKFLVTKKDSTDSSGSEFLHSTPYVGVGTAIYAEGFAGLGLPVLRNLAGNQYVISSTLNNNFSMATADKRKLTFANRRGATGASALDGSAEKTATASLTGTVSYEAILGSTSGGFHSYDGLAQEAIFYNTDKSTDRTSIEENIGDYFTQNTPLLDTYSGAAAAYSLRLLDSTYTGDAVEVYNGSSYADIGFNVFGELDTVALAAHCGSNDGFVSKWYDQAGSKDAAQTATGQMPKIYDGSTGVVTEGSAGNEKPAVEFENSKFLITSSGVVRTLDCAQVVVCQLTSNGSTQKITEGSASTLAKLREQYNKFYFFDGTQGTVTDVDLNQNLFFYNRKDSNDLITWHKNAVSEFSTTSYPSSNWPVSDGSSQFAKYSIGASTLSANMKFQELITWNIDQSSNRTGIEDNINTFYSIY